MTTKPTIFISYNRKDEVEKDYLLSHLGVLQGAGLIDLWSDHRIAAGDDWQTEISQAIVQAKIAVLLVTANFLNSKFILQTEVPELLRRRQTEGLIVVPVIARACAWRAVGWLRQMDVRPRNRTPIWSGNAHQVDEQLAQIAEEILQYIYRDITKSDLYDLSQLRQSQPVEEEKPQEMKPPPTPRRVLVVEDEPSWQRRLNRILGELDCKVVTASDYDQVEQLFGNFDFDLVTVDLNLDKSTRYADGLELTLRIREMFGDRIPIIIVTGTGDLEEQRRAFRDFNVFDFIQKERLDIEELKDTVIDAIAHQPSYTFSPRFRRSAI